MELREGEKVRRGKRKLTGKQRPWKMLNMDINVNTEFLRITPEILSLIAEIDEFKGAWRALGQLAPEQLSALKQKA